ncbi:hypothetical protein [Lactobacillus corticis]|uniref:Uncharacterized protein n=1 Tax=Lactobacillus corticis TaxID=2201249 RepID=A0A916VHJ5_9LACO|nr:hypothetical protein [Lactobacillus corticis]GFZ26383.1 hypothetical protein LCB40_02630 [Lactobacillus corticis]
MKRQYLTQTLALLLINLCWNFSYAYLQLRNTAKISIFWDQHDPFLQITNLGLWLLVWSVWRTTQAEVLNTPMLQLRTGSKLKYFQKLGARSREIRAHNPDLLDCYGIAGKGIQFSGCFAAAGFDASNDYAL